MKRIYKMGLPGQAGFNQVLRIYRANAKIKGINFLLTDKQCKQLLTQNCTYCGSIPDRISRIKGKSITKRASDNSTFIHAGIDRVDSNLDYEISNCVLCCFRCNWMKSHLSVKDFMEYITKILQYQAGGVN